MHSRTHARTAALDLDMPLKYFIWSTSLSARSCDSVKRALRASVALGDRLIAEPVDLRAVRAFASAGAMSVDRRTDMMSRGTTWYLRARARARARERWMDARGIHGGGGIVCGTPQRR